MSQFSCGIDFGTTNSSAAIADGTSKPLLAKVEGQHTTIPSALFFNAFNGSISLGRAAMQNYMSGEQGRFMRSLKRVLGTSLMNTTTLVNDKAMKFEHILGYFIKNLKQKIDTQAQTEIQNVVMGRPVHFRDNDKAGDIQAEAELKRIAVASGFKNVEFQFEPIAAAFAHESKLEREQLAFVIDIGGGTSDFTLIRLGPKLINKSSRQDDILASTGVRIGGNDFDKDLSLQSFMPELGLHTNYKGIMRADEILMVPNSPFFDLSEWSSINSLYSYAVINQIRKIYLRSLDEKRLGRLLEILEKEQGHKLLDKVENTKIALTSCQEYTTLIDFLSDCPQIKTTQGEFEAAVSGNVQTINKSIKECLRLGQVAAKAVDLIVLTGGSTEIPYVQKQLCSLFPEAHISGENKLSSVGLGLAYDSQHRF